MEMQMEYRNIIIQNNIVIEILDMFTPGPDPEDTSLLVVTSDNPNIEIGWLYIDGEFIQN
jgi:hypothetical protein